MDDETYIEQVLVGWEEVAKRGQLTLWVLLALKAGPKHMAEIRLFLAEATNGTIAADDQSLYRALRRYHETELVDFEAVAGHGPDRKVYRLTPIGAEVLRRFVARNVAGLFFKPHVLALLEEGGNGP